MNKQQGTVNKLIDQFRRLDIKNFNSEMVSRASPFACQVEEEGSGERATWLLNDVTLYYANKLMVSDCPAVHVEKKNSRIVE